MKKSPLILAAILTVAAPLHLSAALAHWDSNGATPEAGVTPTGIWGTDAFWSTDPAGSVGTTGWTPGDTAVFSAGMDAIGAYTVTLSANQTAAGIVVDEGTVSLAGFAVVLGAGSVTVNAGATLSTDSSLRISTTAGSTVTVNGGTLRTTNPGAAGTFFDTDSQIILGAAGGTFSHTTANVLNIVQTATKITGTGSLTKTGAGVLAIASTLGNNTYAGGTIVNDGELRIRTVVNTLPITTALTVNSPGIFNLNSVSQQVGSLSGNGRVGTGNGTLTVGDATDTTFIGTIENIANAGASGVNTGTGKLTKVGAGSLTLSGANTYTGLSQINLGTIRLGASDRIADVSNLRLNGGTFDSAGFSETLGTLDVDVVSILDFGAGASALAFADSDAQAWLGTLTILDWTPGLDTFRVGLDGTGFDAQLALIQFADYGNAPGQIDADGFITPLVVPEPTSALLCALGGLGLLSRRRRRAVAWPSSTSNLQ